MAYRIPCPCGKGVFAEAVDAGARLICGCGRAVLVPNLSVLRRTPPVARRNDAPKPLPPSSNPEAQRNLNSGKWWLLAQYRSAHFLRGGSRLAFNPSRCRCTSSAVAHPLTKWQNISYVRLVGLLPLAAPNSTLAISAT